MKIFFIVLFFELLHICPAMANMAKPEIDGSSQSEAYSASDVDILNEELRITLIDLYTAHFKVVYTVKSDMPGFKMPLMFDAMMSSLNNFKVWMDSSEVVLVQSPSIYDENYFEIWKDSLRTNFGINVTTSVDQFRYFVVDMSTGVHTICVEYDAVATVGQWHAVNEYTFFYNLDPARSWRSFGQLNITIDASRISSIADVTTGDGEQIKSTMYWNYDKLPQFGIVIKCKPQIDGFAQFMVDYGYCITWASLLLLFALHVWCMWRYRVRYPHRKFSLVMFWGSWVVVFLVCVCYMYHFSIVDHFIGQHASHRHGYTFLIFLYYPVFLLIYLAVVLVIDGIMKKKLNS